MWLRRLYRGQETGSWKYNENEDSYWAPARSLDITWAGKNDNRYWQWQEGTDGDEAVLQQSWLVEINTTFDASKLFPGNKYKVSFELKRKDSARGWDSPARLRLYLPYHAMKLRKEDLGMLPTDRFKDVEVGEFVAPGDNRGLLVIQLGQRDSSRNKTGLVVKGVKIKSMESSTE